MIIDAGNQRERGRGDGVRLVGVRQLDHHGLFNTLRQGDRQRPTPRPDGSTHEDTLAVGQGLLRSLDVGFDVGGGHAANSS